jgi:NAD(P)-dependent dehydrogenase (short-subunit alcohol dehydrogenase family)
MSISSSSPSITPGRFAGKTAIVTGAGSGIGRATAVRLAQEGARVIAAELSESRLQDLQAEFPELDLIPVAGDISREDDVQAVVAAANGRVDALANVAGIMDAFLPPAEVDDATWQRVFDVNLHAVMRLTRAVLPLMIEAGHGSIINVSSEASLRASASGAAYTASKHAVNGYTKSVAVFYKGNGIRCNAVAPGCGAHQDRGAVPLGARCRGAGSADAGQRPGAGRVGGLGRHDRLPAERRREQHERRHRALRRWLVRHLTGR